MTVVNASAPIRTGFIKGNKTAYMYGKNTVFLEPDVVEALNISRNQLSTLKYKNGFFISDMPGFIFLLELNQPILPVIWATSAKFQKQATILLSNLDETTIKKSLFFIWDQSFAIKEMSKDFVGKRILAGPVFFAINFKARLDGQKRPISVTVKDGSKL